ncbi:hypothetical protein FSP39_015979 [Pinctada imbricata]|uniref:Uncharacterized protein n=1 Tax=Pinctada imbricata TaxID=66713 RepID=A0AA88XRF5_PINIB|nr:hypothetical protein FSP39_015979 [Pinctada imbricata]
MERLRSRYLRRLLGVPKSICSKGLYSKSSKLQIPISSITEEINVTKARHMMVFKKQQRQVHLATRPSPERNCCSPGCRKKAVERGLKFIGFARTGCNEENSKGILVTANDWQMQADVGSRTVLPREIVTTNSRPDIVMVKELEASGDVGADGPMGNSDGGSTREKSSL